MVLEEVQCLLFPTLHVVLTANVGAVDAEGTLTFPRDKQVNDFERAWSGDDGRGRKA